MAFWGLCLFCAVPTSPLDDPANFRLTLLTPQHADSIYYVGDTLRLLLKTDMNTTGRSLNVNISSLQHTYFDTTMAISGKDSIALKYALNEIADLKISARATLSDKSVREVSTVVYVKGRSPQIVSQSDTAIVCSLGVRCSLWVAAQGTPSLRYQWYKGNLAIADTFAYYAKNHVALSDSGEYFCIVSNGWNPADTSNKIRVMVRDTANNPPHFLTQSFTMTIAKGATGKSAVPLIAKDTIDRDFVFLHIDSAQTVLPAQSAAGIDSSKLLNVAIPQNATIGNSYKIAIIADDHKGGLDTLIVSVSVFDPTESDTIRPTITADPGNPANGSVTTDSILNLRYVIQDFNSIYRAVFINSNAPADTHSIAGGAGVYAFSAHLKHGFDTITIIAIDSSINRNIQKSIFVIAFNRCPSISLVSPANGESGVSKKMYLQWSAKDPDGDHLVSQVFLGTVGDQLELIGSTSDTQLTLPTTLSEGTNCFWKVVTNDGMSTAASNIRSFRINNLPGANMLFPANGAQNLPIPVCFSWNGTDNDAGDASSLKYSLYLAKGTGAYQMICHDTTAIAYCLRNIAYSSTYHWKIVVNDGHDSTTSVERTFSTWAPECRLDSLKVYGSVLTPIFNRDSLTYAILIPSSQDSIQITAIPVDSIAKVTINNGPPKTNNTTLIKGLRFGLNSIPIVITAGDSISRRTYNVNITKNARTWQKVYGTTFYDWGKDIVQCPDSGFLVVGTIEDPANFDIYAIRLNKNGDTLWTKRIDNTNYDEGAAVCSSPNKGYVLAGGQGSNAIAVFLDSIGRVQKKIQLPGVLATEIMPLANGFLVCGYGNNGSTKRDFILSQINSNGDIILCDTIANAGSLNSNGICAAPGGFFIFSNTTIVKLHADFTPSWQCTTTAGEYFWHTETTSDGGCIISGETGNDLCVWRLDSLGKVLWKSNHVGAGQSSARCVIKTSHGSYAVTGFTNEGAFLGFVDFDGTWGQMSFYGAPYGEYAERLLETFDGGYIIAGSTRGYGNGGYDVYLIKTDQSGISNTVSQ